VGVVVVVAVVLLLGCDYDDPGKQAPRPESEGEQGEAGEAAQAIKRKSDLISSMPGFSTRENRRMF
jgi:hypothetical protein